jgi:Kef-type K+ transport system membrane component KefB
MNETITNTEQIFPFLIMGLGGIIIFSIILHVLHKKIKIPSLIGFILLGFCIKIIDSQFQILNHDIENIIQFLAEIGIITLLFRVGLESNLNGLLKQIGHASIILIGNIIFSTFLGYYVAYDLLHLGFIPSLFIAVALTATSVGISVSVWQETGKIESPTGELLLDIAEMDDIVGIILMSLLLFAIPIIKQSGITNLGQALIKDSLVLVVKFFGLMLICILFSKYIEPFISSFFRQINQISDSMLVITGFGFIIASIASLLGFSYALGAFFAGLVFSRDPQAVKLESPFRSLYLFFTPFFFLHIGLLIELEGLSSALWLGLLLLIVAIFGKLIGNGLFSLLVTDKKSALLIGISMIPRAEIALIVMQKGRGLGSQILPSNVFSAMILVCMITCTVVPLILRQILKDM